MALKKKKKPNLYTASQVHAAGDLLLSVPKLHSGTAKPSKISLFQMPDKQRFLVSNETGSPEFIKIKEVIDLISAYEEVVEFTIAALSLFSGEDQDAVKH